MKLNIHCHTTYSDGRDSIREMARVCKEQGHVALVTSDHDYLMTPDKYMQQLAEAEALSLEMRYPIICGLEISMWNEEAVLIGTDACKAWLEYRLKHRVDSLAEIYRFHPPLSDIMSVLSGHSYGLCLVHPHITGPEELYKIFHCYEYINGGSKWPQEDLDKLATLAPQARPIIGLDAHSATGSLCDLEYVCNEVEDGKWDEDKIIEWIRNHDDT